MSICIRGGLLVRRRRRWVDRLAERVLLLRSTMPCIFEESYGFRIDYIQDTNSNIFSSLTKSLEQL
jgi:hypothetical protein